MQNGLAEASVKNNGVMCVKYKKRWEFVELKGATKIWCLYSPSAGQMPLCYFFNIYFQNFANNFLHMSYKLKP